MYDLWYTYVFSEITALKIRRSITKTTVWSSVTPCFYFVTKLRCKKLHRRTKRHCFWQVHLSTQHQLFRNDIANSSLTFTCLAALCCNTFLSLSTTHCNVAVLSVHFTFICVIICIVKFSSSSSPTNLSSDVRCWAEIPMESFASGCRGRYEQLKNFNPV